MSIAIRKNVKAIAIFSTVAAVAVAAAAGVIVHLNSSDSGAPYGATVREMTAEDGLIVSVSFKVGDRDDVSKSRESQKAALDLIRWAHTEYPTATVLVISGKDRGGNDADGTAFVAGYRDTTLNGIDFNTVSPEEILGLGDSGWSLLSLG